MKYRNKGDICTTHLENVCFFFFIFSIQSGKKILIKNAMDNIFHMTQYKIEFTIYIDQQTFCQDGRFVRKTFVRTALDVLSGPKYLDTI